MVELKNVCVAYNKGHNVINGIDIHIDDGDFTFIVGASGAGKSTLIKLLLKELDANRGEVYVNGYDLVKMKKHKVPEFRRTIGVVFQDYRLIDTMTVYENMAFSLKLKKAPKDEIDKKVREAAAILDITQYLDRKPKALSGGQRQRVAIGRAIVRDPKVLLMDEPLSNLDAKLRNQMRAEIIKLRQKIDTTFIYVTHDQVEAMTLGDRIVIMKDGFIQQIGTPQEVFNHPTNLFAAGFIGTPQMNFFDATLKDGVVTVQGHDIKLNKEQLEAIKGKDVPEEVILGVRPIHIQLASKGIEAKIDVTELMGGELHLHVDSNDKDVVIVVQTTDINVDEIKSGETINYTFKPELMHIFDKKTEKQHKKVTSPKVCTFKKRDNARQMERKVCQAERGINRVPAK